MQKKNAFVFNLKVLDKISPFPHKYFPNLTYVQISMISQFFKKNKIFSHSARPPFQPHCISISHSFVFGHSTFSHTPLLLSACLAQQTRLFFSNRHLPQNKGRKATSGGARVFSFWKETEFDRGRLCRKNLVQSVTFSSVTFVKFVRLQRKQGQVSWGKVVPSFCS